MLKGESPEEVLIAPMTSMQVYVDEDDVAMWRVCKIESGKQVCSVPQVLSMGPVTEVVCKRLHRLYWFAVAYLKADGQACAREAKYAGNVVWWGEEVNEKSCCASTEWRYMN